MSKRIEDVINSVLSSDAQRNALELIACIRASEEGGAFTITQHDEKDESGWNVEGLGFIVITGSNDFPGPWTMWLGADKLGEHLEDPVDESVKEFAWKHVSPCGSCGGQCSPGASARVFGKDFENTCQANLMFHNPDAEAVGFMKKIIDIWKQKS